MQRASQRSEQKPAAGGALPASPRGKLQLLSALRVIALDPHFAFRISHFGRIRAVPRRSNSIRPTIENSRKRPDALMAKLLRKRYSYLPPDGQVDHLVVGAGAVVRPHPLTYLSADHHEYLALTSIPMQGLAIAERLVKAFADRTTFVVER